MDTGIYCIKNNDKQKIYIGQSKNIRKRWCFHKWQLNHGNHNIKELQNDWDAGNNISFEIIELCEENELDDKECFWIRETKANKTGYNTFQGGKKGPTGIKRTEKHCERISKSLKGRISPMKGKRFTQDHKNKIAKALKNNKNMGTGKDNIASRPVRSITTGIEYECAAQAGRECGSKSTTTPGGNIIACCNKRREYAFNQQWEYIRL